MKIQLLLSFLLVAFSSLAWAQTAPLIPLPANPLLQHDLNTNTDSKNKQTPTPPASAPPARKPNPSTSRPPAGPNTPKPKSPAPDRSEPDVKTPPNESDAALPPPAPVRPSADITGTWRLSNGQRGEFFQEGAQVYSIYNGGNFKHFMAGEFISPNEIQGQVIRINLNDNCRTTMSIRYTVNGNSLTETWTALDSYCDLKTGQTASGTLTKTEQCAKPMNPFGGSAYNPSTDMTGAWGEAEWFQDGANVYCINNYGSLFKHFFQGTRNGPSINGAFVRINRDNHCRTVMNTSITLTDANHCRFTASVEDGNCDLPRGWSQNGTEARVPPQKQK